MQFKLIRNGVEIAGAKDVYEFGFNPHSSPGIYRIVASLNLDKKWTTWVFTNPIYIY
ncbi:MAG: hypothetical protein GWP06_06295 [Actinobacteria bacterium]|nr:hypothetical protein [Actinomycetota bacterium]